MEHNQDAEIIATLSRPQMEPVTFAEVEMAYNTILKGNNVPATPQTKHIYKYLWAVAAVIAVLSIKYIDIPHSTPGTRTYSTTTAQRARITLPDGSVALLAPKTKIRYSSNRTIELEGQALFTVVQSSGSPFVVKTYGTQTRVLGTSFTVRRYADDTSAEIAVAEGKVSISRSGNGQSVVLTTGDQASINNSGNISRQRISDVAATLAWTQGRLEFTRIPLHRVIADAERMYGVEIKLSSRTLSNQMITGVIDQSSPAEAVRLLAAILGVNVERNGNTFTLMER